MRQLCVAQFCASLMPPSTTRVRCEGDTLSGPRLNFSFVRALPVSVETPGVLFKSVVNSRLPIGRLKQSITSLSRAAGMRLAEAEFSVDLV